MTYRYLLGDSSPESERLQAQARLWDPTAHALFDRIGIRPGWKVLEIGPGMGSLHLELPRVLAGPVDAVEISPVYAARVRALAAQDGMGDGEISDSALLEANLPRNHYDLIFARWVFLFLPDAEAHLQKLVASLRSGGILAIEDYYRDTFVLVPRPPEWPHFLEADRQFFLTQGGDANVGSRLPQLFREAGLRVEEVTPNIKTGLPGDDVWNWLSNYYLGVLDRYAGLPPFNEAEAARLREHWLAAAEDESSLMIAPMVLDVVGRKV